MSIKSKIIHFLGGYTTDEYKKATDEEPSIHKLEQVYADTRSYSVDNDNLIYDKTQLARRIGECMLDNDLIDFTIKQKYDEIGTKIYEVRAKAYVGKLV